jgi:hypothetical protein
MTGDYGGAWIHVVNNTLIDPGNYGVAAAGGTDITLENNKIVGSRSAVSNVGIYVWLQSSNPVS